MRNQSVQDQIRSLKERLKYVEGSEDDEDDDEEDDNDSIYG